MGIIEFAIQEAALQAHEKGMVEQKTIQVRNMLAKTDLSLDQIADISECSLDFVKSVRKHLND